MYTADLLVRVVNLFIGIVITILGLRVLFRLLSANADSSFVNWIYNTSGELMAPFRGIFPSATIGEGYVLDISALFAMVIYALIGYLVIVLLGVLPVPGSDVRRR